VLDNKASTHSGVRLGRRFVGMGSAGASPSPRFRARGVRDRTGCRSAGRRVEVEAEPMKLVQVVNCVQVARLVERSMAYAAGDALQRHFDSAGLHNRSVQNGPLVTVVMELKAMRRRHRCWWCSIDALQPQGVFSGNEIRDRNNKKAACPRCLEIERAHCCDAVRRILPGMRNRPPSRPLRYHTRRHRRMLPQHPLRRGTCPPEKGSSEIISQNGSV